MDMTPSPSNGRNGSADALVLIADDDLDIRELVALRLRNAGYEVITAENGEQALRLVDERTPDLLLLDVSMPGMDGLEVCRRVQHGGPTAPPVIFLTARAHPAGCLEGFDAGAVDYVTKPFRPAELLARVSAAIRAKAVRDAFAREATTDGLTAILNRRGLELRAEEAFDLARRYERPLACLMVDIDHFKRVNDTHGHRGGDAVLRQVAERIRSATRISDIVGRYGGEEFVLLLPETDEENAVLAAEKVRRQIADEPLLVASQTGAPATVELRVSVGVACFDVCTIDAAELISSADAALYQAKRLGRDRVVVSSRLAAA
jgi:diguanylate cyclase (GGDEF)-like protein